MANDKDNDSQKWQNKIKAERANQSKNQRQKQRDVFSEKKPKVDVVPLDKGGGVVGKAQSSKEEYLQKAKVNKKTVTKNVDIEPHIKKAKLKTPPSTKVNNAKNIQKSKSVSKPKGRTPRR